MKSRHFNFSFESKNLPTQLLTNNVHSWWSSPHKKIPCNPLACHVAYPHCIEGQQYCKKETTFSCQLHCMQSEHYVKHCTRVGDDRKSHYQSYCTTFYKVIVLHIRRLIMCNSWCIRLTRSAILCVGEFDWVLRFMVGKIILIREMTLLLKHNKTRDQIVQTNTHTQRHMNDVWSETVTFTSCVPLWFM